MLESSSSSDNPRVVILGGQPGAGKSNLIKLAQQEIFKGGSVATINGDEEERTRILRTVPVYPEVARGAKELMGKERLLKSGFNLVEAERAYGKDWLDK